jgi:SNF2 family DNA or RNA helicase
VRGGESCVALIATSLLVRVRDPMKLACDYDLVVTTYATLASDYGKNGSGTNNPLHKIKWHRVVFDEGERGQQ